jgi:hydroxymethylglutaryl-CoA reductase
MNAPVILEGFSRLSKEDKIRLISESIMDPSISEELATYWHPEKQELFDHFSENTLTNYYLPFGIAPNFFINGKIYHIPMVVEESSVVAAAAASAKFWMDRGGFHAKVLSTRKKGHIHFLWHADKTLLFNHFENIKKKLIRDTHPLTANMVNRGGGIYNLTLEDYTDKLPGYFRLAVDFETADSMGANFINTTLEAMANSLIASIQEILSEHTKDIEIIMSILSNHYPDCLVECSVQCNQNQLDQLDGSISGKDFARKFKTAVDIACLDPFRAVTHNKGIMNGIDAVVLATGNDFRAIEAGAHAFAANSGVYKSLSTVELTNDTFKFTLLLPLALGTVGGLTVLHPLAKRGMQILGNPSAKELMMITASVGLASNFAAVKALITNGIQKGHMRMHLSNLLNQFQLTDLQKQAVVQYFNDKPISYSTVKKYVSMIYNL